MARSKTVVWRVSLRRTMRSEKASIAIAAVRRTRISWSRIRAAGAVPAYERVRPCAGTGLRSIPVWWVRQRQTTRPVMVSMTIAMARPMRTLRRRRPPVTSLRSPRARPPRARHHRGRERSRSCRGGARRPYGAEPEGSGACTSTTSGRRADPVSGLLVPRSTIDDVRRCAPGTAAGGKRC